MKKIDSGLSTKKIFRTEVNGTKYVVVQFPESLRGEFLEFLNISDFLKKNTKWLIPKIFEVDEKVLAVRQEDLGDLTLQKLVKREGFSKEVVEIYKQIIRLLVDLQSLDAKEFKNCRLNFTYEKILAEYDKFVGPFFNLNYPKFDQEPLKELYERVANSLSQEEMVFCHRDLQSSNIMILKGKVKLVDYQGARLALPLYDLVALIEDTYVMMPRKLKDELREYYLSLRPMENFYKIYLNCLIQRKLHDIAIFDKFYRQGKNKKFLKYLKRELRFISNILVNEKIFLV